MHVPYILQKRNIIRDILDSIDHNFYSRIKLDRCNDKLSLWIYTEYFQEGGFHGESTLQVVYCRTLNYLAIYDPEFERQFPNRQGGSPGCRELHDKWIKFKSMDKFLEEEYYFQASLVMDLKFTPEDIIELKEKLEILRENTQYGYHLQTGAIDRYIAYLKKKY